MGFMAIFAAGATVATFSVASPAEPRTSDQGTLPLSCEMMIAEEDRPKTALELRTLDASYRPFAASQATSRKRYAYLWIRLSNPGDVDCEVRVANRSGNYHVEMLAPERYGAATLYRQGDGIPVSSLPIPHNRAVFPALVPAGATIELVLEYHDPRGVTVAPSILSPMAYFAGASAERAWLGFLLGAVAIHALGYLGAGLVIGRKELVAASGFAGAIGFLAIVRGRLLFLAFPSAVYPSWLLPLAACLVAWGASAFSWVLFGPRCLPWQRKALVAADAAAGLLVLVSAAAEPSAFAEALGLLSLAILAIVLTGAIGGLRAGDLRLAALLLAFLPWTAAMAADVLGALRGFRPVGLAEHRQLHGLAATLLLLDAAFLVLGRHEIKAIGLGFEAELAEARSEMNRQFASLADLRARVYSQAGYQLRQPLEAIMAMARILSREHLDPGIAAATALIADEAEALALRVDEDIRPHTAGMTRIAEAEDTGRDKLDIAAARAQGRICLLHGDPAMAARKALILQAEGFQVIMARDSLEILTSFEREEAEVLVVDPGSIGEEAFAICDQLREKRNMLELPILMITNQDGDYQRRKGYATGVNDFLTRPFSTAELTARVQSLIRLKQVARHNHDLARSETEKNAFLYFLTHNVNTPLTVLLNRVRELEEAPLEAPAPDCLDDLRATSREMGDIVQNVLISFRLADGRQTIRFEDFDLRLVLAAVDRDLRPKAEAKGQRFEVKAPGRELAAQGDFATVKAVIYNVADNAIKFSPRGASITVELASESPLRLEIRDTGPGIPHGERGRLFRRFECLSPRPTGGESSTGLGLYVAAELARMNGARLEYIGSAQGARFALTFSSRGPSGTSDA